MNTFCICRLLCSCLLIGLLAHPGFAQVANLPAQSSATASLLGFTPAHAEVEQQLEQRFDKLLQAKDLDAWMKRLSAHPHHLGSAYDHQNALFLDSLLHSWGYETEIDTYEVLFPTPEVRVLELTAPHHFEASLMEKPVPDDPYTQQIREALPPFNAYSADGDVTGQLVYVNYGLPEDYELLARYGIDVKGKIVIARYGHSWRGIKPKVAAEHGAIGCLIYSDPADDGFYQGDTYPTGPFKNQWGVQRGSVMDMPVYSGDPLTPGVAATPGAQRLSLDQVKVFTKIPVLPISYHDAQPLLAALSGPVAPPSWRGALPITYHLGAGPAVVHLKLKCNWNLVPCYDVIARMPGNTYADQWIIRGNHYDAWVHGAADPISGQVAMLAEAKALAILHQQGWQPQRTIVFCAWDGEEQGLLGSTEWVEGHLQELQQKAVVYLNSDGNGRGFLGVGGSHTLEKFFNEVALSVPDPETDTNVLARLRARIISREGNHAPVLDGTRFVHISALGSGSDYSPFLQHAGIASLNVGYGGEDEGGEYHTLYDTYLNYIRFKDSAFSYGITLSKTMGRCILRLANCDLLPFDFTHFTQTVKSYVSQLQRLEQQKRDTAAVVNQWLQEKIYTLSADPQQHIAPPAQKKAVPYLDFSPLLNAISRLDTLSKAYASYTQDLNKLSAQALRQMNLQLPHTEQKLLDPEGLPHRPWYQHTIYAPGLYTGYGVKTLPGAREAIEQDNWTEAQQQIQQEANALNRLANQIADII
ncbi:MAG: M28 family peptidase, partial [Thermoflavifilum sp.]|nr:M28 family peptidase [Thermoflavifilum sp.]